MDSESDAEPRDSLPSDAQECQIGQEQLLDVQATSNKVGHVRTYAAFIAKVSPASWSKVMSCKMLVRGLTVLGRCRRGPARCATSTT